MVDVKPPIEELFQYNVEGCLKNIKDLENFGSRSFISSQSLVVDDTPKYNKLFCWKIFIPFYPVTRILEQCNW
jgi:hypothetical protein